MIQDQRMPLVSIGIPTFNRQLLLKRAIESALAQTYPNLEIIVSDNASTDGTQHYLSSLNDERLKTIVNSENLGMVANWDKCLAAAKGEYFLLMSDDDALISTSSIKRFLNPFLIDVEHNIGVVFSDVILERSDENKYEKTSYCAGNYCACWFHCNRTIR